MPNHFPPWSSFHADAWQAFLGLVGLIVAIWRTRSTFEWHVLPTVALLATALPWLHFGLGLLPFAGQAWISSAYLLGFTLALLVGALWEKAAPGQLAAALLLAIAIACAISVWLQLATWLGLLANTVTDIWSMGLSGERPYANLGQPNNLATLLLWGMLACLWAYQRQHIGHAVGLLSVLYLMLGLALTQSRTAMLGLTVLLIALFWWRTVWRQPGLPWIASGLYLLFWLLPFLLSAIHDSLLLAQDRLAQDSDFLRLPQQGELRLSAWRLFLQAIVEQPWLGYGWTELRAAQTAVAMQFPSLGGTFGHSHNLVLDLLVWNGIPIGLTLAAILAWWFWETFKKIQVANDIVPYLMLVMVSIHALLELPLHYAYFLLPAGMFMGILHTRTSAKVLWTAPSWMLAALWLIAALIFVGIVRDYFRVEASYNDLRFEKARIGTNSTPVGKPPSVLLLTQMRELIRSGRYEVHPGMNYKTMNWLRDVATTFPSSANLFQLAQALALNGQPSEAQQWLQVICKTSSDQDCKKFQMIWLSESEKSPLLATVIWPN